MTLESNIQSIVGSLVLQLAQAQTTNQQLNAENEQLKAQLAASEKKGQG